MRVKLDLISCRDKGECAISAPHIFSPDTDGKQSPRRDASTPLVTFEVSEKLSQELEEAIIVCPMQAISMQEVN